MSALQAGAFSLAWGFGLMAIFHAMHDDRGSAAVSLVMSMSCLGIALYQVTQ